MRHRTNERSRFFGDLRLAATPRQRSSVVIVRSDLLTTAAIGGARVGAIEQTQRDLTDSAAVSSILRVLDFAFCRCGPGIDAEAAVHTRNCELSRDVPTASRQIEKRVNDTWARFCALGMECAASALKVADQFSGHMGRRSLLVPRLRTRTICLPHCVARPRSRKRGNCPSQSETAFRLNTARVRPYVA
jgi:hypothetical protein